jgi:hypothetical protein
VNPPPNPWFTVLMFGRPAGSDAVGRFGGTIGFGRGGVGPIGGWVTLVAGGNAGIAGVTYWGGGDVGGTGDGGVVGGSGIAGYVLGPGRIGATKNRGGFAGGSGAGVAGGGGGRGVSGDLFAACRESRLPHPSTKPMSTNTDTTAAVRNMGILRESGGSCDAR